MTEFDRHLLDPIVFDLRLKGLPETIHFTRYSNGPTAAAFHEVGIAYGDALRTILDEAEESDPQRLDPLAKVKLGRINNELTLIGRTILQQGLFEDPELLRDDTFVRHAINTGAIPTTQSLFHYYRAEQPSGLGLRFERCWDCDEQIGAVVLRGEPCEPADELEEPVLGVDILATMCPHCRL